MNKTVGTMTVLLLLIVVGCASTAPVLNIKDASVPTNHTPEAVRQAIVAAGAERGWLIRDNGAGHLRGTLHVRTHDAEVDITYSSAAYSITYVSSTNLNYDGGKIHGNYNRWIANLNQTRHRQQTRRALVSLAAVHR